MDPTSSFRGAGVDRGPATSPRSAATGEPGDVRETAVVSRASRTAPRPDAGTVFIIDVEEALQIRTGKTSPEAV